jgi:ankyrin repeat protein/microsomal dipeptidase-like Zn-dependent dipeptidase/predicted choloylglycine hydrolase
MIKDWRSILVICVSVFLFITIKLSPVSYAQKSRVKRPEIVKAAKRGDLSLVKELVRKKADVNTKGKDDTTALHCAAQKGYEQIVGFLIKSGADINMKNKSKWSALNMAASNGHIRVVEILLENKADVNTREKVGNTPLHWAVTNGHINIMKLLLKHGADVNSKNNVDSIVFNEGGLTPICYARDIKAIEVLIKNKADVVDVKTFKAETLLEYFIKHGYIKIVNFLLTHEVDMITGARSDVNVKDFKGATLLHYSTQAGLAKIVKLLLEYKADVNVKTRRGETPLHYASKEGHVEITELLIRHGADINARNNLEQTPLFTAVDNHSGDIEMVEVLLKHNADVNAKDMWGETALHNVTFLGGRIDMVRLLLKYKAAVNIKNTKGFTPLDMAEMVEKGEGKVKTLLSKYGGKKGRLINKSAVQGFVFKKKKRARKIVPVFKFSGTHRQIGKQMGKTFKKRYQSLLIKRSSLNKKNLAKLDRYITMMMPKLKKSCPEILQEFHGVAEGAQIDVRDLLFDMFSREAKWFLQNCSQFAIRDKKGNALLGKAEDNGKGFERYALIEMRPKDRYAILHLSLNYPSWIGCSVGGLNEKGLAITQSSGNPDLKFIGEGIPKLMLLRLALERCATVVEAVKFITAQQGCFKGMNYTLLDETGDMAVIEFAPTRSVVRKPVENVIYATNHYEAPKMQEVEWKGKGPDVTLDYLLKYRKNTYQRYGRLACFADIYSNAPYLKSALEKIFRSHGEGAICQHEDRWDRMMQTTWAVIVDPKKRLLWLSAGLPCENEFMPYKLEISDSKKKKVRVYKSEDKVMSIKKKVNKKVKYMRIANKGRALVPIVIDPKASPVEEFAAKELQRYLNRITGSEFTLRRSSKAPGNPAIVVSRAGMDLSRSLNFSDRPKKPESYLIAVEEEQSLLIGADDRGVLYAVYAFLEEDCGVFWLAPARGQEVVPRKQILDITIGNRIDGPVWPIRMIAPIPKRRDNVERFKQFIDFSSKIRLNSFQLFAGSFAQMEISEPWDDVRKELIPEFKKRGLWLDIGHNSWIYFMCPEKYFKKHPEWFSLDEEGKRVKNRQICFSSKEAINKFEKNVREYLKKHPEVRVLSLGLDKIWRGFCQCEGCRSLNPMEEALKVINRFALSMEDEFPDVKFAHVSNLGYGFDFGIKPHKNILVYIVVGMEHCFSHGFYSKCKNNYRWARFLNNHRKNWLNQIILYDCHATTNVTSNMLMPFADLMQKDIRDLHNKGFDGYETLFTDVKSWWTYSLNLWMFGKLLWDPQRDAKKLMAEWVKAAYPTSFKQILPVYKMLEDIGRYENRYCYNSFTHSLILSGRKGIDDAGKLSDLNEILGLIEKCKARASTVRKNDITITGLEKDYLRRLSIMLRYSEQKYRHVRGAVGALVELKKAYETDIPETRRKVMKTARNWIMEMNKARGTVKAMLEELGDKADGIILPLYVRYWWVERDADYELYTVPRPVLSNVIEGYLKEVMVFNEKQEVRAKKLHNESIIIIAHDHCYRPSDFKDMKKGGVTAKVAKLMGDNIVWIDKKKSLISGKNEWPDLFSAAPWGNFQKRYIFNNPKGWRALFDKTLDSVIKIADNKDSNVAIIRSVSDIYKAKKEGKQGVILGNEGARFLEGDINAVEYFYKKGLREIQFFWPPGNQLFDGKRLSKFGKEVIRECNRLGILIDLSHIDQASAAFREAIEIGDAPFIISHNAPRAMGAGELSDDTIKALAASGNGNGVLALHFVSPDYIVNQKNRNLPATIKDFVKTLDYVVKLVGIDHVAVGADFFQEKGWHFVLKDITQMPQLTGCLIKHGYSDKDIKKILGLNMIRLFKQTWKD